MSRRRPVRHARSRGHLLPPAAVSGVLLTIAGLAAGSALAVTDPLASAPTPQARGPVSGAGLRPDITQTRAATSPVARSEEDMPPATSPAHPSRRTTARPSRSSATRRPTTTPPRAGTSTRTSTRPARTSTTASGALSSREETVLTLTNKRRAENDCGPLRVDTRLVRSARGHAEDMVENNFFDHNSPDGTSPGDRARAAGFPTGVGENIAVGYSGATAVMQGWMNSPGHRANILNCDYTVIGVGYASGTVLSKYGSGAWVQVLGRT